MIAHHPYGNDDPYKRLPTERYPRAPKPDEEVHIGFRTSKNTARAWVVLNGMGERCFPASPLGDGLWTSSLGPLPTGTYSYRIFAAVEGKEEASETYLLEVGHWTDVRGVTSVQAAAHEVALELRTSGEPAQLTLTFPLKGVCRSELSVGKPPSVTGGLPCSLTQNGPVIHLQAEGITVDINQETLELTAFCPGASEPSFRGSLRGRWLADAKGLVSLFETSFELQPEEWLYGLGERFEGANRRGHTWDVRVYEEYKEQGRRTYLPVPFVVSNRAYGLWLEANEPSYFDLQGGRCRVSLDKLPSENASLPLHIIVAQKPYELTAAFTKLTGDIVVPPKWAFGPWMSANTWNNQAKAEEVIRRTLKEDVPATVLVLEAWSDESTFYIFNDADYDPKPGGEAHTLEDFRFGGRWPDPKGLVDECHENGVRVLLWQIPVQKKLEEAHSQHDRDETYMLDQGYYIRNADGSPYHNKGWWFTDALIIDFTNPQARDWWFNKRRYLFEGLGIDGMKTDGGEHLWGRDLIAHDGKRGLELYNLYPNLYVGAYYDFVQEMTGGDGLTFSRAGYTGAQRYPCHWAGDENSTWQAFKASILAGLSAGVSGLSMWSWDIAGFSGEIPTVELYLRSTAMAAFCPIMQYHSELHSSADCRDRSPWNIAERHRDPTALTVYRYFAQLRMRLLDYLYEEAQVMSAHGLPLMRYPALEYPEAHDFLAADPYAYLFGRDLLVCPVTEKGAVAREVRLPPGDWVELWSGASFSGPRSINMPAPIDRLPVFVRADSPNLTRLLGAVKGA